MTLGAFSVSLNVADIAASQDFYGKIGFTQIGGDADQGWLILRNGNTIIGLFQGMLAANTLTFNPGWDQQARNLDDFEDIRDIQRRLKAEGLTFVAEADETTSGPASFILMDPDGNPVLFDQHR
ncbi:VOC family protein [Yoonia sp.]|uniref:VOC family protein n=1 Tax=Yoonia sp. TaxID=2212373 RepID=UPI002FDAD30C